MTTKFNYVVFFIEESNDVTSLFTDELQSSLLVHEPRMKITKKKEDEQVLKIASYDRGCINNRGRGRGGFRGMVEEDLVDQIQCYKCHKIRHYQSECQSWKEYGANFAEFDESQDLLQKTNNQVWFLDSGCSNHMAGTKEWMFSFDERFRESVKLRMIPRCK